MQFLQGGLCSVLCPLHRPEGRVCMLVSLPRGDGFVSARKGVKNIALPSLLERVCNVPVVVLQGSLGHIVMVGWASR